MKCKIFEIRQFLYKKNLINVSNQNISVWEWCFFQNINQAFFLSMELSFQNFISEGLVCQHQCNVKCIHIYINFAISVVYIVNYGAKKLWKRKPEKDDLSHTYIHLRNSWEIMCHLCVKYIGYYHERFQSYFLFLKH